MVSLRVENFEHENNKMDMKLTSSELRGHIRNIFQSVPYTDLPTPELNSASSFMWFQILPKPLLDQETAKSQSKVNLREWKSSGLILGFTQMFSRLLYNIFRPLAVMSVSISLFPLLNVLSQVTFKRCILIIEFRNLISLFIITCSILTSQLTSNVILGS